MRRTRTSVIFLAAAILAGCSTTGPFGREKLALPVGPSYVGGKGTQMYPTSTTLVANVKEGMADVGIHSIQQSRDPGSLIILEGRTADDRHARITVQGSGTRATVSARIGWMGDEPLTRALLDRIGTRQGVLSSPPIPSQVVAKEPEGSPILSRDAVPDRTMLRNQIDAGYSPTVIP